MPTPLSLQTLSDRVNSWCEEHAVTPANGQAGEAVSERNIRYYRTLGLVDAAEGGGYGEKHLLQLVAIRLLQSQGLPLRRIRDLLYGRSLADLREIQRRGVAELRQTAQASRMLMPVADEVWRVIPLDEDFLLVSRRGAPLSARQREAILLALQNDAASEPQPATHQPAKPNTHES